jgi:hypothetical protein
MPARTVNRLAVRATKFMKQEEMNEDPESVGRLLREWKVTSALPPRFAENVWRRIEKAETPTAPASNPTLWIVLKGWAAGMLRRPAFALSYVSALLVAGLVAGYWHARVDTTSWDKALESRYVQAVDPFQKSVRN